MEKIVIIGAGLIGATLAFQLARSGRAVTVVEAGLPAAAASGRSFGWINASFALSEAHFALRVAGMAAHEGWRRLCRAIIGPVGACGGKRRARPLPPRRTGWKQRAIRWSG
jgi:glycine/D-amino acid oxidase-like deaminating enzyme